MTTVVNLPFVFSHIFAEGWNAGRRAARKPLDSIPQAAAANPYATEPERRRWSEGFAKGIE
jgi:hypothetical protein